MSIYGAAIGFSAPIFLKFGYSALKGAWDGGITGALAAVIIDANDYFISSDLDCTTSKIPITVGFIGMAETLSSAPTLIKVSILFMLIGSSLAYEQGADDRQNLECLGNSNPTDIE